MPRKCLDASRRLSAWLSPPSSGQATRRAFKRCSTDGDLEPHRSEDLIRQLTDTKSDAWKCRRRLGYLTVCSCVTISRRQMRSPTTSASLSWCTTATVAEGRRRCPGVDPSLPSLAAPVASQGRVSAEHREGSLEAPRVLPDNIDGATRAQCRRIGAL
jgi:hypothetical protein